MSLTYQIRFPTTDSARRMDEVEQILKTAGATYVRTAYTIIADDLPPAVWSDCDATWHGW